MLQSPAPLGTQGRRRRRLSKRRRCRGRSAARGRLYSQIGRRRCNPGRHRCRRHPPPLELQWVPASVLTLIFVPRSSCPRMAWRSRYLSRRCSSQLHLRLVCRIEVCRSGLSRRYPRQRRPRRSIAVPSVTAVPSAPLAQHRLSHSRRCRRSSARRFRWRSATFSQHPRRNELLDSSARFHGSVIRISHPNNPEACSTAERLCV